MTDEGIENLKTAMRRQEVNWLLTNIQSRIHFTERDVKRVDREKPFEKAKLEGKLSILYVLRSDLQNRLVLLRPAGELQEIATGRTDVL